MNNRYIIGFNTWPRDTDIAMTTINTYGGQIIDEIPRINAIVVIIPDAAIEDIRKDSNVKYIEIDQEVRIM